MFLFGLCLNVHEKEKEGCKGGEGKEKKKEEKNKKEREKENNIPDHRTRHLPTPRRSHPAMIRPRTTTNTTTTTFMSRPISSMSRRRGGTPHAQPPHLLIAQLPLQLLDLLAQRIDDVLQLTPFLFQLEGLAGQKLVFGSEVLEGGEGSRVRGAEDVVVGGQGVVGELQLGELVRDVAVLGGEGGDLGGLGFAGAFGARAVGAFELGLGHGEFGGEADDFGFEAGHVAFDGVVGGFGRGAGFVCGCELAREVVVFLFRFALFAVGFGGGDSRVVCEVGDLRFEVFDLLAELFCLAVHFGALALSGFDRLLQCLEFVSHVHQFDFQSTRLSLGLFSPSNGLSYFALETSVLRIKHFMPFLKISKLPILLRIALAVQFPLLLNLPTQNLLLFLSVLCSIENMTPSLLVEGRREWLRTHLRAEHGLRLSAAPLPRRVATVCSSLVKPGSGSGEPTLHRDHLLLVLLLQLGRAMSCHLPMFVSGASVNTMQNVSDPVKFVRFVHALLIIIIILLTIRLGMITHLPRSAIREICSRYLLGCPGRLLSQYSSRVSQ
ncbi:hypothetical protein KC361_g144 [Hortaea werneckii]|nr:hypothetical protein KC361_g144 [Hortaea werneckii]